MRALLSEGLGEGGRVGVQQAQAAPLVQARPLHGATHAPPSRSPACPPLHATPLPETGLAAVQLASDHSVHKLSLDDVSQYEGPEEED